MLLARTLCHVGSLLLHFAPHPSCFNTDGCSQPSNAALTVIGRLTASRSTLCEVLCCAFAKDAGSAQPADVVRAFCHIFEPTSRGSSSVEPSDRLAICLQHPSVAVYFDAAS